MRPYLTATVSAIVLLTLLTACASRSEQTSAEYGNFVDQQPRAYGIKLADDAVLQLMAAYVPARTTFELQQKTPDAFGQHLVETLRDKGYAVQEQNRVNDNYASPPAPEHGTAKKTAPAGLELKYIVDRVGSPSLYRLTMLVGGKSMTRAYLEQDGALKAAGAWVRKE